MSVFRPKLPPMSGYVEKVDEFGNHYYKPTEKKVKSDAISERDAKYVNIVDRLLGNPEYNQSQTASEMFEALRVSVQNTVTDEVTMMRFPSVYPEYKLNYNYKAKTDSRPADVFRYGFNASGDPQLWMVLQNHKSSSEFPVETSTSLYKKIGVSEDGTPEWVQPLGATDAYSFGDVVVHDGKKWKSTYQGANVWEPGVYGWEVVSP